MHDFVTVWPKFSLVHRPTMSIERETNLLANIVQTLPFSLIHHVVDEHFVERLDRPHMSLTLRHVRSPPNPIYSYNTKNDTEDTPDGVAHSGTHSLDTGAVLAVWSVRSFGVVRLV